MINPQALLLNENGRKFEKSENGSKI